MDFTGPKFKLVSTFDGIYLTVALRSYTHRVFAPALCVRGYWWVGGSVDFVAAVYCSASEKQGEQLTPFEGTIGTCAALVINTS